MNGSDLQSTEAITKFLRNKDTSVEDVYFFTTQKLFSSNPDDGIYLPQKEKFILDLLVDRISQTNKLAQSFKSSEKTWELFNFVWEICNSDQRLMVMRSKVISKLKFGEIFSKILAAIMDEKLYENVDYINAFSITFAYLVYNLKIHLSDDQSVGMLKILLKIATLNFGYGQDLIDRILSSAHFIFTLNNKSPILYDFKHRAEFCRESLSNTIISIDTHKANEKILKNLKSMIVKVLFGGADDSFILKLIEQFASVEANNVLSESQVVFLLNILIPRVEITVLEDIVKILVQLYPYFSATLIKNITEMNKTLSFDFLSSLVTKALKSDTEETYSLIIYSIKRSPGVALHHSIEIADFCCKKSDYSITLFKELVDAYANTRELEQFFKLWAKIVSLHPNQIFESDEIIAHIATKLITLSQTQLVRLVEEEVDIYQTSPDQVPVFLLAMCKGFLKGVSGSIKNSLSKSLIFTLEALKPLLVSIFKVDGKYSWKLKFYLLTLFDVEDIEEYVLEIKSLKPIEDEYYYFTILRIIEQECELPSKKFVKKFLSYYRKKSTATFKNEIFNRWFMVIECFFSKDEVKAMVEQFIEISSDEQLKVVLQNPFIQTQTKTITHFVDYFITHDEKIWFLESISVYAMNKAQREKILNCLISKLHHPAAITIIKTILKMPTYKSKLETEFESLVILARAELFELINIIIQLHLQQPTESAFYLKTIFEELYKTFENLNSSNSEEYCPYLKVASIFIREAQLSKMKSETGKLVTDSVESVNSVLMQYESMDIDTTCVLIEYLTDVAPLESGISSENVKKFVSEIGCRYSEDEMMKQTLFKYICALDKAYPAEYVLALYIILEDEALYETVNDYILHLTENEEVFVDTWMNVINSLSISKMNDLKKYIQLITAFIKNVQKPVDDTKLKMIHSLFVASISSILLKLHNYTFEDGLECTAGFIEMVKAIASSKIWLFTQYSMELLIEFVVNASSEISTTECSVKQKIYINLCQTVSSIILYQRRRLSNRHHLINEVFISLLKALFISCSEIKATGALAFERLISNLCEPNIHNLQVKSTENAETKDASLNNALAQTKAGLRKHIPILIFNYIKFYLQFQADLEVKPHLDNSVYMMLDLLTLNELNYINKSLDQQGRTVFKTLYDDYKRFYKWNEE